MSIFGIRSITKHSFSTKVWHFPAKQVHHFHAALGTFKYPS